MTVAPLLAVGIMLNLLAVLFVVISIVLVLVVLIQKGRGGGLSAAFGGGMASGLLGSKTGDFLTWATITLVAVYLVLAVLLDRFYKPTITQYRTPGQTTTAPQAAPQEKTPTPQPGSTSTSPGAPATPPAGMDAGAGQSQPAAQPPAQTSPDAGANTAPEPNSAGG
jgi:preprotein translocase subunit SecG